MRAHAEAVGNWLKVFLLFVNAVAAAPPPSLVNEWPVRRIHQTNDSMVNAHRHVGSKIGKFVFFAELLNHRRRLGCFLSLAESRTLRTWVRHIRPDESILLFAGIAACINTLHFQILVGGK